MEYYTFDLSPHHFKAGKKYNPIVFMVIYMFVFFKQKVIYIFTKTNTCLLTSRSQINLSCTYRINCYVLFYYENLMFYTKEIYISTFIGKKIISQDNNQVLKLF